MSHRHLDRMVAEWRANRRLRLIVLAVLLFAAGHGLTALAALTEADQRQYAQDLELQLRLESLQGPNAWAQRAEEAEAALAAATGRVPEVTSAGLAQAELQAWMGAFAGGSGIEEPRIRVEDTLDVPGHPDLWQVIGRIDGQIPQYAHGQVLRALSEGLPWIQADRIEIGDGMPSRLSLVVRGYYRRADAPSDETPATDAPVGFDDGAMLREDVPAEATP